MWSNSLSDHIFLLLRLPVPYFLTEPPPPARLIIGKLMWFCFFFSTDPPSSGLWNVGNGESMMIQRWPSIQISIKYCVSFAGVLRVTLWAPSRPCPKHQFTFPLFCLFFTCVLNGHQPCFLRSGRLPGCVSGPAAERSRSYHHWARLSGAGHLTKGWEAHR